MKKFRLILALGLLMVGLSAQGQTQVNGVWYQLNSPIAGEAMVVVPSSGTYSGNIEIPATIHTGMADYDVTAIGELAFAGCTELLSVIIGKNVKVIHEAAFDGCGMLASVTFEDGSQLEEICYWAFINCSSLTEIELPESLLKIRERAFNGSGLKSIFIPANVALIEANPFAFCVSLESIEVATGNANFSGIDGVLFTAGAKELVAYPAGNEATEYSVPAGVEEIWNYAFAGNQHLESVTTPSTLERIGAVAFVFSAALKEIVFEEGLEVIYSSAFAQISTLEAIALPSTVTNLGQEAFYGCTGVKFIASMAMTPPALGSDVFKDVPYGIPLYLEDAAKPNYTGDPWDNFDIRNMSELEKRATLFGLCDDMEDMIAFGTALGIPDAYLQDLKNAQLAAKTLADNMLAKETDLEAAIPEAESAIASAITLLKSDEVKEALINELDGLLEPGDSQDCKDIVTMAKVDVDAAKWDDTKSVQENLGNLHWLTTVIDDVKAALEAQRAADEIEAARDALAYALDEMYYLGNRAYEFLTDADGDFKAFLDVYNAGLDVWNDPAATKEDLELATNNCDNAMSAGIEALVPKMKYLMKEELDLLVSGAMDAIVQIAEDAKAAIDAFEWDYMEHSDVNTETLYGYYADAKDAIDAAKSRVYVTVLSANSARREWNNTADVRYKKALIVDFESGMAPFKSVDADGDGFGWFEGIESGRVNPMDNYNYLPKAHSGEGTAYSLSYSNAVGALTPDNWLISPEIHLGGSTMFWETSQDPSWPVEHFGFYGSTASDDIADFVEYQNWTNADGDWHDISIDYSGVEGKGYVAIRHFDCTDMFMLNIDDIEIYEGPATDWVQFDEIPNGNLTLHNLDEDYYYSVQISENGGTTWSAVTAFKAMEPTSNESVQEADVKVLKFMQNGQVIIRKNGKSYNVLGAEVE